MKKGKKKVLSRMLFLMFSSASFFMVFTVPVYAYIDPATTAMITQIVAGILISAGVFIGAFRRKIFLFFKNISVRHMKRKIAKQQAKQSFSNNNSSLRSE